MGEEVWQGLFGDVEFPKFYVADGQHRLKAYKAAVRDYCTTEAQLERYVYNVPRTYSILG
jgi:hypothetical protein